MTGYICYIVKYVFIAIYKKPLTHYEKHIYYRVRINDTKGNVMKKNKNQKHVYVSDLSVDDIIELYERFKIVPTGNPVYNGTDLAKELSSYNDNQTGQCVEYTYSSIYPELESYYYA